MGNLTLPEKLQRLIYYDFLQEPGLAHEAGLEDLPQRLGDLLECSPAEALPQLLQDPWLERLPLAELRSLLQIKDMALVSRTAAAVSADLKRPEVSYDTSCRSALCYAVIGSQGHAFSALRAAAAKNDSWARHHYLYGLLLGLQGDADRARWELEMALRFEPYEEGRIRIRRAISALEEAG